MEEEIEDQKQFFSDLGATAEQTVQEVRGFEENYYALIHGALRVFPRLDNFNEKLQTYIEQNFAAAYDFSRELTQAKDMQDFTRIHSTYNQKCFQLFTAQVRDFAEICTGLVSGVTKAPAHSSAGKLDDHRAFDLSQRKLEISR
jgi:hypothetical protein